MDDFRQRLYEALLVAFGKILSKYNTFAQGSILRDVGKEIINYLKKYGFEFEEKGNLDDLSTLTELFIKNGFSERLEIMPADKGQNYVWHNLYGIEAYEELHRITDNPFLACPLNLCLYYLADKHNKTMRLHRKTFDMKEKMAQSQYELVDKDIPRGGQFDALIIENVRLYDLAQERAEKLEKAHLMHKRMEVALLESEKRFRDVAENAQEWVWEVDAEGRYTYASPIVERLLGYEPEEILSKHFYDLFFSEDREELKKMAFATFAAKQPFREFINRNLHKDGSIVWLSTSGVPILDKTGNLSGYRGADIDISERKQAEAEIIRQREEMRGLATRLAEVEELERQRLARELHDQVCQNLATIALTLETLKIRAQQEPLDQLLKRLSDASILAEQTGEITRDIMEGLRPTVLDHYGLMGGLRQLGSQFSQRAGIDLEILGEETDSRLKPDVELALFRIAQEALNNVAKHAQASQVVLTKEGDQDSVRLVIADNGIGFDQNLVTQSKAGRGWGLITMTERVRAVGGHCRIESQPGHGTRVVVEVPR